METMKRPIVASLPMCLELYRVSGWDDTPLSWYCDETHDDEPALNVSEPEHVVGGVGYYDKKYPAYDMGYLAVKIPSFTLVRRPDERSVAIWDGWENGVSHLETTSNWNPVNTLCRLAIAMFEAGVFKRTSGQ